jgi:hypothetical protein
MLFETEYPVWRCWLCEQKQGLDGSTGGSPNIVIGNRRQRWLLVHTESVHRTAPDGPWRIDRRVRFFSPAGRLSNDSGETSPTPSDQTHRLSSHRHRFGISGWYPLRHQRAFQGGPDYLRELPGYVPISERSGTVDVALSEKSPYPGSVPEKAQFRTQPRISSENSRVGTDLRAVRHCGRGAFGEIALPRKRA